MRRGTTSEELTTQAVELAERGRALASEAASREEAKTCLSEAIRIFKRLAIVESAAKRELIQGIMHDLKQQMDALHEPTVDEMLGKAMEINEQAREEEDRGNEERCIELYLSAGDWYMKAYNSFGPEATSAKNAVGEQIEYIINHVSKLKEAKATRATAPAPTSPAADEFQWPTAPDESTVLVAKSAVENDTRIQAESMSWPVPPLPSPILQSATSQASQTSEISMADQMRWPLPPGVDQAPDTFDWPMPPLPQAPKQRSFRQSTAPIRVPVQEQPPPTQIKPAPLDDKATSYSPEELDVLRRSSQINGHIFVPWLDDLDSQENFRSVNVFVDPDGPVPLSAKQIRKGATWMRPSEFAQLCTELPVMIDSICPQVVKQDIVTDCSFVASLCIAAAYEQRFQKRLITNIIFPVDPRTRQPMYNPSGKYIVKLWANGVPRKVVIDDLLPVDTQARELLCSCTTRKNELWVSLIEKAYLKLCGGYDYPGGNSGIDLFALTGWIPERIALADLATDSVKEDRIWEQLKSAFHFGDCIITMTTGDIDKHDVKQIGLVPMHVYAVLNVFETSVADGEKLRLLHVKNPWRKLSWKGPYSKSDAATWHGAVGDALRAYQSQYYALGEQPTASSKDEDDGLFWIDLASVKRHFESLYLNWNPALFPHKYAIHEHWPVAQGPANDAITLAYNPQYSLRFTRRESTVNSASSSVWVLLTRHVRTVERDSDATPQQFLTLHVYRDTHGQRVYYNQHALHRGTYSNNPHTLLSLDVDWTQGEEDEEPSFTLVASQYDKLAPLDYTLSVFATTPFECRPVPHLDALPHAITVDGAWRLDDGSAGGRPFFRSFMDNPQFHVQLHAAATVTKLTVFLETTEEEEENSEVPVNLRVVTHSRERACGLPAASAAHRILSSGEYRPGFCYVEVAVAEEAVGQDVLHLVLVPSTFEPKTAATFRLRLVAEPSTSVVHVRPLAAEGWGMERTVVDGQWDLQRGTAVGCASYGCYTFNPKFLLHVAEERTQLFVRLVPVRARRSGEEDVLNTATALPLPACNVSVFASNTDGVLMLSTSPKTAFRGATSDAGAYASGNPSGVVTPKDMVYPAGWYVIVPSTYDPVDAAFELRVLSSKRVTVRPLDR